MSGVSHPHRRFNPLLGSWVLCSPQRLQRPWEGQKEVSSPTIQTVVETPTYDPACKLCPGNNRATGVTNPDYKETYVFTNDFPAIFPPDTNPNIPTFTHPYSGDADPKVKDLFVAENTDGLCRVICFSPLHTKSLPELPVDQIRKVVDLWTSIYQDLSKEPFLKYAQIFENKGAIMGCSNPHPHSQVWSSSIIPDDPAREIENSKQWKQKHGSCLLCDYVAQEAIKKDRIVVQNESFVAVVPYWAVWPFETLLLPTRHVSSLLDLNDKEKNDFAVILKSLLTRYDNLFEVSFPYSSGLHQLPFHADATEKEYTHLHMHFLPPLLRSATVKKFMVGYEMLASPQRDLTAEYAAQRLREMSEVLFSERK